MCQNYLKQEKQSWETTPGQIYSWETTLGQIHSWKYLKSYWFMEIDRSENKYVNQMERKYDSEHEFFFFADGVSSINRLF